MILAMNGTAVRWQKPHYRQPFAIIHIPLDPLLNATCFDNDFCPFEISKKATVWVKGIWPMK
jgi:hypothetical protein